MDDQILWFGGALAAYRTTLAALQEWAELREAEKTRQWLVALQQAERDDASWEQEAKRFKNALTPDLMHAYHRGVPHLVVRHLSKARSDLKSNSQQWILSMVSEVTDVSKRLADAIVDDPDNQKRHRFQVFPALPTIQCLSLVDGDTHLELCHSVARLLEDTQGNVSGYTESGRDQINQIVPQILTDQLIAGPHAWRSFYVTDQILSLLMSPAQAPENTRRFETGLALSAQFLVYYNQSLEQRRLESWAKGQPALIKHYLQSINNSRDPILRDLAPWIRELQDLAAGAAKLPKPHEGLVRQSSSAIIAAAYKTQDVSDELLQLCVMNNLRAACRSFGLPDETSRLERTRTFLGAHGITRNFVHEAINKWMGINHSMSSRKALDFVDSLPSESGLPEEGGSTVGTTRGMTLDELWQALLDLRQVQARPDKLKAMKLLAKDQKYLDLIGKQIARACHSIFLFTSANARLKREYSASQIEDVVKRAVERDG